MPADRHQWPGEVVRDDHHGRVPTDAPSSSSFEAAARAAESCIARSTADDVTDGDRIEAGRTAFSADGCAVTGWASGDQVAVVLARLWPRHWQQGYSNL
jgi:hypothetical protein